MVGPWHAAQTDAKSARFLGNAAFNPQQCSERAHRAKAGATLGVFTPAEWCGEGPSGQEDAEWPNDNS